MKISNEDIELIEKFIDISRRGYYASGVEVTNLYNRVLDKRLAPSNCGSCIKQRINELEAALNQFKKSIEVDSKPSEALTDVKADNVPQEENKAVRKAKNNTVRKKE